MTQRHSDQPFVYLVDDDENIRRSLSRALVLRGYVVETFESAKSFLEIYDGKSPGCLILDFGLPEMDGLELQRILRNRRFKIPIIFITGHGGIPESVQAIKMGALDFLEKPFQQSILIEKINLAFETDRSQREAIEQSSEFHARFGRLTDREQEVAQLLVSNPGSNSSKDIARHLNISPRTVDHHRARILEKMDVSSVSQLIELVLKTKFDAFDN